MPCRTLSDFNRNSHILSHVRHSIISANRLQPVLRQIARQTSNIVIIHEMTVHFLKFY